MLRRFFPNIAPNPKLIFNEIFETAIEYEIEIPLEDPIDKYKNHPSTKMIISKINLHKIFFVCSISYNEILKEKTTRKFKTIQQNDIQQNAQKFIFKSPPKNVNCCIKNSKSPSGPKLTDVNLCCKRK